MKHEEVICTFRDVKPNPDLIHTYDASLHEVPIIIDHGLFLFKYFKSKQLIFQQEIKRYYFIQDLIIAEWAGLLITNQG